MVVVVVVVVVVVAVVLWLSLSLSLLSSWLLLLLLHVLFFCCFHIPSLFGFVARVRQTLTEIRCFLARARAARNEDEIPFTVFLFFFVHF